MSKYHNETAQYRDFIKATFDAQAAPLLAEFRTKFDALEVRYDDLAKRYEERLAFLRANIDCLADMYNVARSRAGIAHAALDRIVQVVGKHGDADLINEVCGLVGQYQRQLGALSPAKHEDSRPH